MRTRKAGNDMTSSRDDGTRSMLVYDSTLKPLLFLLIIQVMKVPWPASRSTFAVSLRLRMGEHSTISHRHLPITSLTETRGQKSGTGSQQGIREEERAREKSGNLQKPKRKGRNTHSYPLLPKCFLLSFHPVRRPRCCYSNHVGDFNLH